jgi:hypothetical protein
MAMGREKAGRDEGGIQAFEKNTMRDLFCAECNGTIPEFAAIPALPTRLAPGRFMEEEERKPAIPIIASGALEERPRLEIIREGVGTPLIVINGFQSSNSDWTDWVFDESWIPGSRPVYGFRWDAKGEGALMGSLAGVPAAFVAGGPVAAVGKAAEVLHVWTDAVTNSSRAAFALAAMLRAASTAGPVDIVAHSLGARVAIRALDVLRDDSSSPIRHLITLGAAIARADSRWGERVGAIQGRWVHGFSSNDHVLDRLFSLGAATATAAGLKALDNARVSNVDCSSEIGSHLRNHFAYCSRVEAILRHADLVL